MRRKRKLIKTKAIKLIFLKTIQKALLLSTLFLASTYASAGNILNLGEGVNLIASNGKEVNSDSFFNSSSNYKLPNGTNQILVNYTAEIKKGSEDELEHTDVFVLLFESHNSNITISAPEIKKPSDINKFEEIGNWNLANKDGEKIKFKFSIIEKKGFQLSRDYEREIEDFNNTDSAAALPKKDLFNAAQLNASSSKTKNNNNSQAKENMPAQMLIFWYNQADENTRKSFKELINNQ